jgi:diacylglycerol kinase
MKVKGKFLKSFANAYDGIKYGFKSELNLKVQILCSIVAIISCIIFSVNKMEWIIILFTIGLVLSAELFNTAIETICNKIEPNIHPQIKIIKDISASAVLVVAIAAAIVGAIIFVPKIF